MRSVSPLRSFQLATKENVSYKPLLAVNTMVKKPESVVKKTETAVQKSFSRPTHEIRHRDVLNHIVRKFVKIYFFFNYCNTKVKYFVKVQTLLMTRFLKSC